ncbi:MAG: FAD-dependent thymidylate synthase [Candidatus Dormibacteraeota bacterium]|nr:FAD-dependent thymidylate synthase [Candidatus Dormibacteraeota bacterium]
MAVADQRHLTPVRSEFAPDEAAQLEPYFTNLDRPVFALRNLPEVVKGALFSRYSRTEKSLRRVLLEEFLREPEFGLDQLMVEGGEDRRVATRKAEEFYERVLVGYGDDSVAELAGAHVAVEGVSTLAAKALQDSRIGLSPLEKSTRYVRFDRPDAEGRFAYHRSPELSHPIYERAADHLFETFSDMLEVVLAGVRDGFPIEPGETERAWKTATRAKALDLLRGLLPAATHTNLGLYGNGRAFEYLITKMAGQDLPECRQLASSLHGELSQVIPSFVRRAIDDKYGRPAALRLQAQAEQLRLLAPLEQAGDEMASVKLIEYDTDAERKVVAAALFPHSAMPLAELQETWVDPAPVLEAILGGRTNRRQRAPRALEHATYTFEVVANFAAYRDLQRHRMLTQDRQLLGASLGYDVPSRLVEMGLDQRYRAAMDAAGAAWRLIAADSGPQLAQYIVPLGYRIRWYFRVSLREIFHLCELRTTPQGHPDYRRVAQQMFRRVHEVHPRLAQYAKFVDLGPGDELERRASERRLDEKLRARETAAQER